MEETTYKVILKGLVQGVGFRHFAYTRAHGLGLRGWAKNLASGDLEVMVQGSKDVVNQFIFSDLKTGPSEAHVKDMSVEEYKATTHFPFFLVHQ